MTASLHRVPRLSLPGLANLIAQPSNVDSLRRDFEKSSFLQIPGFFAAEEIKKLLWNLAQLLEPFGARLSGSHSVVDGALRAGGRYVRFDPFDAKIDIDQRRTMAAVSGAVGVPELVQRITEQLCPITQPILAGLNYQRWSMMFYREGDYISPHDDEQSGDRFNVQVVANFDTVSALRILGDEGLFLPVYDDPSALRILGPKVWHEVPAVLAASPDKDPLRVNLTLRYA